MLTDHALASDHFECPVCLGSGYRPYPAGESPDEVGDAPHYKCLGCSFCFSNLESHLKRGIARCV